MGQNQGSSSNPQLMQWKSHPITPNIFVNIKTNELAQLHTAILTKNQIMILKKRVQQNHNFITKILYFEPTDIAKINQKQCEYNVYTQKLLKLSSKLWIPTNSSLSILKGFRRLSSIHGFMKVTPTMIKVTQNKQVRVWINQNPIRNQIHTRVQSEQAMLFDILQIIYEYEPQCENLMKKCSNINDAINTILRNMTDNKSHMNYSGYSYRSSKNQEKNKNTFLSVNYSPNKIPPKKSRELLQSPNKKIAQIIYRQPVKREVQTLSQFQIDINKVQLTTIRSPKQQQKVNQKFQQHFSKKISNFQSSNLQNNYTYSRSQAISKQPQVSLNNSQPTKVTQSKRSTKPQYQVNLQKQSTKTQVQRETNKFKQFLHKNGIPDCKSDYKSNLQRNFKQKVYKTNDNQYTNNYKCQRTQMNENSETGTERQRQITQYSKYVNSIIPFHADQNRTKTQQFYAFRQQSKFPQRAKTNYLNSQPQEQKNQFTHNNSNKMNSDSISVSPTKKSSQKFNMKKIPKNFDNQKIPTNQQQEESKRINRIKQAEKIKKQMSCLGLQSNNTKQLTQDKSERDLLIKQKVEEKNNKHKQLKFEITKLLSQ